mgnify:CR=1 FL=1
MMVNKKVMIDALERKKAGGEVPIWELEFHLWDKFSEGKVILGREFEKLPELDREKALHGNAEIIISVSKALNFSAVTVPGNYWEIAPGEPAYYWLPQDARFKQVKILKEYAGEDLMLIASCGAIMAMPGAKNYVEFCYKLLDQPEEIDEYAQNHYQSGVEGAKRLKEAGIEAVYSASDIADNRGPFFNPEQMDRFILPYLYKWAEEMKKAGIYSILHSDGNLDPCMEQIADSGINALQAIDPVAGMDIFKVSERVKGRLCLCGNVDCGMMVTGPAEKVYEVTGELLRRVKAGGGFVLGASNAVQQETPAENYLEMIRAWKDFGQ